MGVTEYYRSRFTTAEKDRMVEILSQFIAPPDDLEKLLADTLEYYKTNPTGYEGGGCVYFGLQNDERCAIGRLMTYEDARFVARMSERAGDTTIMGLFSLFMPGENPAMEYVLLQAAHDEIANREMGGPADLSPTIADHFPDQFARLQK